MKPEYIIALEDLHLDGWNLVNETASEKVFHKNNLEKRLELFENYSIEKNFKNQELHRVTVGRMNQPFLHYPNYESKIYLIENYHEGKQDGIALNFYDDGSRMQQDYKNHQLNGKWEEWFGNGQKEKEKHYVNGELHGKFIEWYENGQLKLEENFTNGTQNGESAKYLENGFLKRKMNYENGKIEGIVYELWDFRGKLVDGGVYSKTEYKNNLQNGKETVFYANKSKMREGIFKNGKQEGETIWWHPNGKISLKENYKNGALDGDRFLYDENGKLEKVQHYKNGDIVS